MDARGHVQVSKVRTALIALTLLVACAPAQESDEFAESSSPRTDNVVPAAAIQVFEGRVKSVNALTSILKIQDGQTELVFELSAEAEILDAGQHIELADLPKESQVRVEYSNEGKRLIASSVRLVESRTGKRGE